MLQLWYPSYSVTIGSIRAGIGSLRICKISIGMYKYLDVMHGGMRESAESRYIKGTLPTLYMIYDTWDLYMRHRDKIRSPIER